ALRAQYIPATFVIIVHDAFAPQSIIGGTLGTALMVSLTQGAKRGLFSNEAGMGSSPHAHAQAEAPNAHFQGTLAMVGVFIDTFVVLTLNALVIISTLYTPDGLLHEGYTAVLEQTVNANNLSEIAFGSMLGERVGMILVAVSLVFFAFTSILGWYIYGRINVLFLLGRSRRLHRMGVFIYSLISLTFMFAGTLFSSNIVWQLSDIFNNIMVIPNVLAVLVLTKIVVEELKRPAPLN
ncbi:MAG: alanine:cation symporter family protein, partial [Bacteroidaceae bacterium]|nr:alanine:cation symporter family protein [Bacteroidaceae bacterium]